MKLLTRSLIAASLGFTVACSGSGSTKSTSGSNPAAAQKSGPAVAKIGDSVITVDEVKEKLGQQSPFMQARYRDLKHRKEFVDQLIRFELLAQEAYNRGLDKDPQVQETIKKILVQEFIRQSFDEKTANYSEEQLKAYYQKHVDDFVKPERVRVSHIFFAAAEKDAAARAVAKKKAAEALTKLKDNAAKAPVTHPQHKDYKPTLFAELARELSTDAGSKDRGGDLAYMAKEDLARTWSQPFADAVFGLQKPNDLTTVIETPKGFHVASLLNRQLAVNRPFEDPGVRDTLKGRLFREERSKSFESFVTELRTKAGVTVDEQLLAGIEVPGGTVSPVGAPPASPRMNPPPKAPVAATPEHK